MEISNNLFCGNTDLVTTINIYDDGEDSYIHIKRTDTKEGITIKVSEFDEIRKNFEKIRRK